MNSILKKAFFKATHLKKILLWQNLRDEIENIYAHIHIHIHTCLEFMSYMEYVLYILYDVGFMSHAKFAL